MWKQCAYLVLLIMMLALIPASISGAFDAKKDSALVGYWSFDEGKGTVATDSSPFKRNGTLQGGATWGPGRFGSGIVLNGTDAYVAVPNFQLTTDKITMVAWIKGWKAADWAAIVSGHPTRLELGFGDNDTLHYTWAVPGAADSPTTWNWRGGPVIPQDTWALAAVTLDPTKAVTYLYTDQGGLKQGTNAIAHVSQTFTQLEIGFSFSPRYVRGTIDEVAVYSRALTEAEILSLTKGPRVPGAADQPSPGDKATDVPRDSALAWVAGPYPGTHDVYLGTAFADVNTASRTDKKNALASQGQADAAFDPPGVLAYGQTYYWRIDEVNKSADGTIFKGDVWTFTVEPFGYPIKPVKATASSAQAGMSPENTINGAGLTGDLHGIEPTTMWLSAGVKPNWIQYEFDKVYKLDKLLVWNSNQLIESLLGFGAKTVTIETSLDGTTWTPLANVPEFGRAPGAADYAANTTVNFSGVQAKFVKLTIDATWGGFAPQAGLAEVRFSYIPVQARLPQPATAATGAAVSATLDWRPGREAASHQVYLGTDAGAVAKGTTPTKTVDTHGFTPDSLNFGTTYYWRVDEVNKAVTYPGDVWSFTTQEYAVVDDFESYTDQAGGEIFSAWIDGYATGLNGSTVGKDTATNGTFGETTIIHGGKQSMPMAYNNTKTPNFSEAERTFSPAQDWTRNGAEDLVVYFRGSAPGFAETASGSILMNGIGTDVWNNDDQFRFVYKSLSGDGTMVARVDSIFNSNTWAKGGVMIRQSVQAGSVHAFMPITPSGGNGASFQRRLTSGGASANNDSTTAVAAPYWVKIERKGNDFSGYISPDGKAWTQLGTAQTITMNNPVLIGLALCSHDAAIATSAEFSNIATTGNVTGAWQVAEIGAPQPTGNSLEGLYLSVKDSSGKTKVVQHPDAAATASMAWQQWKIPLSEFTSAGVKMTAVKSLTIGVGDKAAPKAGGTGTIYVDDIGFGKPAPVVVANFSFEQPGTVKIKGWNGEGIGGTPGVDIPGWSSDTAVQDSGVETGYTPTDGLWTAFLMGADPGVWQLTNQVIGAGDVFELRVDARNTWQGKTLRITLYYDDKGKRVPAATADVTVTDAMQTFTLAFAAKDVPAAVGKRLGIELDNVTTPADSWIGLDNVRLIFK